MATAYTDYLLSILRAHPDQWGGWGSLGNTLVAAAARMRGDASPDPAAGTAG
jgi:hypothetical protein